MQLILASTIIETIEGWINDIDPKKFPRLLFLTTASEVYEATPWLDADVQLLESKGFDVEKYSVTGKTQEDVAAKLSQKDVIFVEGGNTYYLLQEVQKSGADIVIRHAVENGMPYFGASAGSVLATHTVEYVGDFDDRSKASELTSLHALALVDLILMVHYGDADMDPDGKKTCEVIQGYFTKDEKIIVMRDNHYLHVGGDGRYKIVSVKK